MTILEIRDGILEELAALLSLDGEELGPNAGEQTLEEIGVDSLMMLELMMNIEKRFSIPQQEDDFDEEWMTQFKCVDDIVRMVADTHNIPMVA